MGIAMSFAVVQKSFEPPTAEQLRRAFRRIASLTDFDAGRLTEDAYGILAERLTRDEAWTLHTALADEGIDTAVVDAATLPELGTAKRFDRCEITRKSFGPADALGRPQPIGWDHVVLVAAGRVSLRERRTVRGVGLAIKHGGRRQVGPRVVLTNTVRREVEHTTPVLDILIDIDPWRYQANGDEFRYTCLGERMQRDRAANFPLLVKELMARSPAAWANLGAKAIANDASKTYLYPSRHAFEEEMIWLLWRQGEAHS